MKKKLILALAASGTAIAMLPLLAAFEAHIINVTARIENALAVSTHALEYGTVFPEEVLFKDFEIRLSDSFLREERVDDVVYHIKQKDKPRATTTEKVDLKGGPCDPEEECVTPTEFCHKNRPTDPGNPNDPYYGVCFPNLCPYLSKLPDGEPPNDTRIGAFHRAQCDDGIDNDSDGDIDWPADGQCTSKYDDSEELPGQQGLVRGLLAKSLQDIIDKWIIDLHVPCFRGNCAQDNVIPDDYQLDPRLEKEVFGCDLWIEVEEISERRLPQCSDGVDNEDPEDTLADADDPGCYIETDAGLVYDPTDDDETDPVE